MQLNSQKIQELKHDGRSLCVYWCASLPGFGVRVYPSGRKACVARYYDELGKEKVITIMPCEEIGIREAKEKAKEVSGRAKKRRVIEARFGPPMRFRDLAAKWNASFKLTNLSHQRLVIHQKRALMHPSEYVSKSK